MQCECKFCLCHKQWRPERLESSSLGESCTHRASRRRDANLPHVFRVDALEEARCVMLAAILSQCGTLYLQSYCGGANSAYSRPPLLTEEDMLLSKSTLGTCNDGPERRKAALETGLDITQRTLIG